MYWLDLIFSSLLGYAWLGIFSDRLFIPHTDALPILTPLTWKLALVAALLTLALSLILRRADPSRYPRIARIDPAPFVLLMAIGFWTDFPERRDSFPLSRLGACAGLVLGMIALALGARQAAADATSGRIGVPDRTPPRRLAPFVLLTCQVALFAVFLRAANGRILWSDDHPSFLYRLSMLRENFPHIMYYNTDWNTGYPTRELFATGTLNFFALVAPVLWLVPDLGTLSGAPVYTVLVAVLLILLMPWMLFAAARVLRWSTPVALIAGLLMLAPSMAFFEYALQYGTLPFLISCGFFPLTVSLILKIAFAETPPSFGALAALVATGTLTLAWHASGILYVPIALVLIARIGQIARTRRLAKLTLCALLIVLAQVPSICALTDEGYLQRFFGAKGLPGSSSTRSLHDSTVDGQLSGAGRDSSRAAQSTTVETIRDRANALTPYALRLSFRTLIRQVPLTFLLLAIPACFALRRGAAKVTIISTILWCLLLGTVGSSLKPQLELHRMAYPATLLMILAISWAVVDWVASGESVEQVPLHRSGSRLRALFALSPLMVAPMLLPAHLLGAAEIYRGRSNIRLAFAPSWLPEFADVIRAAPPGRVFFLGFILHEFGATTSAAQDGGHVAPLVRFTGREMFASHYYHAHWSTIDPIPKEFRDREDEGVEEFLDLVNATVVVAFKKEWVAYCEKNPQYTLLWQKGAFRVYRRTRPGNSALLRGKGDVQHTHSRLSVTMESPEIVIKYRWHNRLQVDHPDRVEIFPVPAFVEEFSRSGRNVVYFIGLRSRAKSFSGTEPVRISFREGSASE